MKKKLVVWLVVMLLTGFLVGCSYTSERQKDDEAGISMEWEEQFNETPSSVEQISRKASSLSESHKIMASMILKSNQKNDDLSSYDSFRMYKVITNDNQERMVVVVDGETVFPNN